MTALKKGFTLIELLIVIAILGVLAVVVLVAINPVEQLAKTRDAGRISSVIQLGHAVVAFYTAHNATYPLAATWGTELTTSGELSVVPSGIKYSAYSVSYCTTNELPATDPTWCYALDATNGVLVYARMESTNQNARCVSPIVAYAVYSTADGRGGVICSTGEPTPWAPGGHVYVN